MSAAANTMTEIAAANRARLQDPENFFAFKCSAVPRRQFLAERDRAFAADTATGEGPARMRSLVVQDEGLHFYTRTPGFSWT